MADFNFIYKPHDPEPADIIQDVSGIIEDDSDDEYFVSFFLTQPDWSSAGLDEDNKKLEVTIDQTNASSLSAGVYYGEIKIYKRYTLTNGGGSTEYLLKTYTIQLEVKEFIYTSISPLSFDFKYQIGLDLPPNQNLQITSEESYTLTASQGWIKLDTTAATGSQSIPIGVHVQGLTPGLYNGDINLKSTHRNYVIPIRLLVEGEIDTPDFLFVSPESVQFSFNKFGFLPNPIPISINASDDFTIEKTSDWLHINRSTGDENTKEFKVSLSDGVNSLAIGEHSAQITLRLKEIVKTVNITVVVSQFMEEIFKSDTLYFTDNDNTIRLAASTPNTNLFVGIAAKYENQIHDFTYSVPFFKGESKTHVGSETRKIMGTTDMSPLQEFKPKVYAPYNPAQLDFKISENIIYTDDKKRGVQFQNIPFVKGITPTEWRLTDVPKKIYLTRKGVLSFSFLKNNNATNIRLRGDRHSSVFPLQENSVIQSFFLPLEWFADLEVGYTLKLFTPKQAIEVQIKPDGVDHCLLFWENRWGCWDSFECTGSITDSSKFTYSKQQYRESRTLVTNKILHTSQKQQITVQTGWIYTEAEVTFLENMFNATNIYLNLYDKWIKVVHKTSSFTSFATNRNKKAFTLTFENANQ